jgi:hypothetical protein
VGAENRGADPHLYAYDGDLYIRPNYQRDSDVVDDADNVIDVTDIVHLIDNHPDNCANHGTDDGVDHRADPAESGGDKHGSRHGAARDTCRADAVAARSKLRPGYTGVP